MDWFQRYGLYVDVVLTVAVFGIFGIVELTVSPFERDFDVDDLSI